MVYFCPTQPLQHRCAIMEYSGGIHSDFPTFHLPETSRYRCALRHGVSGKNSYTSPQLRRLLVEKSSSVARITTRIVTHRRIQICEQGTRGLPFLVLFNRHGTAGNSRSRRPTETLVKITPNGVNCAAHRDFVPLPRVLTMPEWNAPRRSSIQLRGYFGGSMEGIVCLSAASRNVQCVCRS